MRFGCPYRRDRTRVARCCAIESAMSLCAAIISTSEVVLEMVSSGICSDSDWIPSCVLGESGIVMGYCD